MISPGVSVTPALIKINLATDPDHFIIQYQNSTEVPVQINFTAQDFTSLEDGWRVKFLTQDDAQNYHYSLSSWIVFSPPSLLLQPQETGSLNVTVRGSALSAGGHYASVIADINSAPATPSAVAIRSQLVSLVFVRANTGHEYDQAKIISFSAPLPSLWRLPTHYVLRFSDSGNTELTPHGLVVLTDPLGHEVHRAILNENSLITLPESVRRYDITPSVYQTTWPLPGFYHATLAVTYSTQPPLTANTTFFSFGHPLNLWIPTVLLTLVLLILIPRLQKMKGR